MSVKKSWQENPSDQKNIVATQISSNYPRHRMVVSDVMEAYFSGRTTVNASSRFRI